MTGNKYRARCKDDSRPATLRPLPDGGLFLRGRAPGGFCATWTSMGNWTADALTVNGRTIGENVKDAPVWNSEVIRDYEKPLVESGGVAVLRGNLCPDGAVLKPSAASPALMKHRGQAVVFESIEHYKERIEDPELEIDESSVMVLKNCGPKGYPGMAEVGNMGLPAKLLARGITDMVRISGCAHERYGVWDGGAACEPGGGDGRTAGAGAGGRLD